MTRLAPIRPALVTGLVAVCCGFVLSGLTSFGIWDPSELEIADAARESLQDARDLFSRPPVGLWLVHWGFRWFGIHEAGGRLPLALFGCVAVLAGFVLAWRYAGLRAGVYTAVIAATSPLLLFNARHLRGEAPAMAAQALLALAAFGCVWDARRASDASPANWSLGGPALWFGGVLAASALSAGTGGVLLGVLPPLIAVALVAGLLGQLRPHARNAGAWFIAGFAVLLVASVGVAILADYAEFRIWLGGAPRGGEPPTFDDVFEHVFHAFAPWSALVPVAFGVALAARGDAASAETREERPARLATAPALGLTLVLWAFLGYGALTLFLSRYGSATFHPVVALAALVALFLGTTEDTPRNFGVAGVVSLLFVGLLVRDFALYPESPALGIPLDNLDVPETFNPRRAWAVALGSFGLCTLLGMAFGAPRARPDMLAPYRWMLAQWQSGWGARAWISLFGLVLALFLVLGGIAVAFGTALPVSTILVRVMRWMGILPFAAAACVAAVQWSAFVWGKLGRWRMVPVVLAGAATGAYASLGFFPALSDHFSPRRVYETFLDEHRPGEPLGEYRVSGRAASYYLDQETVALASQTEVGTFLAEEGRRWVVFPSADLASVNRMFRRKARRHLFVADARSARLTLASNRAVPGRTNHNLLARFVRTVPPPVSRRVNADLDGKIELLGYDLNLPHDGYVGAGESFRVTWHWRCRKRLPGSYKVFVHIDGQGQRLGGDHEPVDEKYPIRLWDEGDVIIDTQELTVPANFRAGNYYMFVGIYAGNHRLKVTRGPQDESDRVRAGILTVR